MATHLARGGQRTFPTSAIERRAVGHDAAQTAEHEMPLGECIRIHLEFKDASMRLRKSRETLIFKVFMVSVLLLKVVFGDEQTFAPYRFTHLHSVSRLSVLATAFSG